MLCIKDAMEKWSDIQPPEILELSRKHLLLDENAELFLKYLGIEEGNSVVDIGCGTGSFTRYLARAINRKANFYGIDLDKKYLDFARNLSIQERLENNIQYIYADAHALPFEDNSIDNIVDFTTLVNLKDPKKYLKECMRVLKKGGRVSTSSFLFNYQAPERLKTIEGEEKLTKFNEVIQEILKKEIFAKVSNQMNDYYIYSMVELFQTAGIRNIEIYGIFSVFSPDDNRFKKYRNEWLEMNYIGLRQQILNISAYPEIYSKYGINGEKIHEALKILEQRYNYEKENCTWIFNNNLELVITGIK